MNLVVVNNSHEVSTYGAGMFAKAIDVKPAAAVVLAVGNSPMGMFGKLTEMKRIGLFDTSRMRVFQLDGYLGIAPDDPRSLEGWLRRSVLEPWDIPEERITRLPEDGEDPEGACREYERKVREAGGYDIAVLGLGPNGHLGFNEPRSDADSPTRVVELTEESLNSNAAYWGGRENVPVKSLTAGMDLLLASKQVILLVTGEHKREILAKTVQGPVTPDVPSSFLQRHPNVTIIADTAAWPHNTGISS